MSNPSTSTPALPIAHTALRILIIGNWLYAAVLVVLLVFMPNERWIMAAFKLHPSPDTDRLILGLRAIVLIGLASVPVHYVVLTRLLAIVETVRASDPFNAANAHHLQWIGWALVAQQFLSLTVGAIVKAVSTAQHPLHIEAGFSINGWLAVLLTFVLARVFLEGARMRDDLAGTV